MGDLGGEIGQPVFFPAKQLQIVGHAGKDIGFGMPQISFPVFIIIDGELPKTRRHELRHPERPRIRAVDGKRIDSFLPAEKKIINQFLPIKGLPPRIEGVGGVEGIERPVFFDSSLAELGFHPQNAADDLFRHPEFIFHGLKDFDVFLEIGSALRNQVVVDKPFSVFIKGKDFGWTFKLLDYLRLKNNFPEGFL